MHTSAGAPKQVQQFYRQSADETLGPWVDVRGYDSVTFYLTSNGTTSGGVISFEESAPEDVSKVPGLSPPPTFGAATGSYSVMTTQAASALSGGAQLAIHIAPFAYCLVRARISTAISGGGTISCSVFAQ